MARIMINIETRDGEFEVIMDGLENPGRGIDVTGIDAMVDEAVKRIRRAYGGN